MRLALKALYDEEFSPALFNRVLKATPKRLRTTLRAIEFRVDPDTYLDYINAIAARMGDAADQYLAGPIGNVTYAGVSLVQDDTVGINCIEVYHPDTVPCKRINIST